MIENIFLKRILGDERRYLQILLNFLSNSIKFTNEKGKILVNIKINKLNYESSDHK
jgi:signal transduction histidine kinase